MTNEQLYQAARSEDSVSVYTLEKASFQVILGGMIMKLLPKHTEAAKQQLDTLNRMDRFLERITYHNVMSIYKSKLIIEQDGQIAKIEQEKRLLQEENINLKKRIK